MDLIAALGAPAIVLEQDRVVTANNAWGWLTGGRPWDQTTVWDWLDDAEPSRDALCRVAQGQPAAFFEAPLREPAGSAARRWWVAGTGDGGSVLLALAESAGTHAEVADTALLAALVASSDDAILVKSLDGVVLTWNHGAERLYGYTAEEMIGTPISRIAPPERVDEITELLALVKTGHRVEHRETLRVRKDGTVVPVSLTLSPVHNPDGSIAAASVIARDITGRRHHEAEQLRIMVENAGDPFVLLDDKGRVLEWNHQAVNLFGWTRAEILGERLADTVIAPAEKQAHLRRIASLVSRRNKGDAGRTKLRTFVTKTGKSIPMEVSLWRITTLDGVRIGGFLRDARARQQIERSLAEARDNALETAHLKTQFLASMSHEIRTPMNAVIGLTSLLIDSRLSDLQRRYAEGIRTAGESLLSLINDILDFSRIEAGRLTLDAIDFEPAAVIEDVVELVADTARRKGLEVIGSYAPVLPATLNGDPVRLRQILLNLAMNAVKFTEKGEVVIRAKPDGENLGHDGPVQVTFEVVDTGIGIAANIQKRLFEPFTQADASITRKYGGSGLGLAISRDLTTAMGGTIEVHSHPGEGSTFRCVIPLNPAAGTRIENTATDLTGVRVLIVDDSETNRLILDQYLTSWGAETILADNGPAAISALHHAAYENNPIHVSLLDYQMPDIDGLQLTRLLRATPDIPTHPILILTSSSIIDWETVLEAGASSLLLKPVRREQLNAQIATLTGRSRNSPKTTSQPRLSTNATGQRLLLAEDNQLNQVVAEGMLQSLGYTIDIASDGRQAVTMNTHNRYDAILMDCHMPNLDGYAATREIRNREPAGTHTPVIALTAAALPEDRLRCLDAGMDDYIVKPVTVDNLAQALHRHVTTKQLLSDPQSVDNTEVSLTSRIGEFRNTDGTPNLKLQTKVLTVLADTLSHHITQLHEAAQRDADGLASAAHTTKGIAGSAGANTLADLCAALEHHASTRDRTMISQDLAAITKEAEHVSTVANRLLARHRTRQEGI